jgi:malate/lactate dehydrogenase
MQFGRLYKNRATAYLLDIKESAMSGTVTMLQDAISVSSMDMGINYAQIQRCVATVQVAMILERVKS